MADLILTERANAEVRRNLLRAFGLLTGVLLLVVVLLSLIINPPGSTQGYRLGAILLGAFVVPVAAMAGALWTLAYPLRAWPAFLRARKLEEFYGVPADRVSNQAIRAWTKRPEYWAAFAKGAVVAACFTGPWFFGTWAVWRKVPEGYIVPALYMTLLPGGMAAKAWVIRRVAAEQA